MILLAGLAICSCAPKVEYRYPAVFAHRGCWFEDYIPENSLDAIRMAAVFGYPTTECDFRWSADSVLMMMHDPTINRTARLADGYLPIPEKTRLDSQTCEELRTRYVLASEDPERRSLIPTSEEYLRECVRCGIKPILHCEIYEGYELAISILGDNWIGFSENYELCKRVRAIAPDCLILYAIGKKDLETPPSEIIARLEEIGGPCGISSMDHPLLREEMCSALSAAGYETQSSIFRTPAEMKAIHDGATIILTDFCWFPAPGFKPAEVRRASRRTMAAGDKIEYTFDRKPLSAFTIDLACKGSFELVVNGERTYPIEHGQMDSEHVGFRMHETEPKVELRALEDGAELKEIKVSFYEISQN